MKLWNGIPYYPVSQFYKETFGEKVYKVPVSTAETCPNREGLRGMKTCNFCDVWGSAAYPELREDSLRQQIETTKARMKQMYKANKYLVYFQAYTNTFEKTKRLEQQFDQAFEFEDVVGAVVGNRPDCISQAVMKFWNHWAQSKFISVEIGVQTFDEEQLIWMRRGHTAQKSLWAIDKIAETCPEVNLGIHLMFGLPGETREQIVNTAKLVNSLPIQNVKLHNLHVLRNTPLEEDFKRGEFEPIDRAEYFERCRLFLQHLSPEIAVHRLSALSKHADELVAPEWTSRKMEMYQHMLQYMLDTESYQSQLFAGEGLS
jgi:radical SAM protein (TIGR01212 family)